MRMGMGLTIDSTDQGPPVESPPSTFRNRVTQAGDQRVTQTVDIRITQP